MKKSFSKLILGLLSFTFLCDGAQIPSEIVIDDPHSKLVLNKTGVSLRKDYYQVVLYLQNALFAQDDVLFFELFSNREISQINLMWTNTFEADVVKRIFKHDFESVLTPSQQASNKKEIENFLAFLPGFEKNDVLILRWSPGGIIEGWKGDKQLGKIENLSFAKALWSIWLGPKSVVNRHKLITIYENVEQDTQY